MIRLALLSVLCLWLLATTAVATPNEVTLFPTGGVATEQFSIAPGSKSTTLLLPEVVVPESLRLELINAADHQRVTAIEYQSIIAEKEPFADLRQTIDGLKRQINALEDQITARRITLDYWQKPAPTTSATPAEMQQAGTLIRREGEALLNEISQLSWEQNDLKSRLKEAERQLEQKTGRQQRYWQVDVQLLHPVTTALDISARYRLRNVGWTSSYVLDARPADGVIEWIWTARINQRSGSDWEEVDLKLATAEPVFTLAPPQLPDWKIREGSLGPTPRTMTRSDMMAAAPARQSATPEPPRQQGQLFDIYDLGPQRVASGIPARIQVRTGNWNADFAYLARPLQSTQAFLEARLNTDQEFIPLPTGTASIQVDGVHVGQRNFSLYQKEDIALSFGSDPGILIEVDSDHVAGERGLLNREKTYDWNWAISFSNHKHLDIELRVEDTLPHAGHEDIIIREAFEPPLPKREDNLLFWTLPLKAGEQQILKYGYSISYPKDMDIMSER